MSYTNVVLHTKQAKVAILEGIVTWGITGDFQEGWNAMIKKGKKNMSYPSLKLAILLDFIQYVSRK